MASTSTTAEETLISLSEATARIGLDLKSVAAHIKVLQKEMARKGPKKSAATGDSSAAGAVKTRKPRAAAADGGAADGGAADVGAEVVGGDQESS